MPSITDLPSWELRNPEVAFKVLGENLGEIAKVNGDGNCRYYAIFEVFLFFRKDQAGQRYPIERLKWIEWIRFGKKNVDHFVSHHHITAPPKLC